MTTWDDFEATLTTISPDELKRIRQLAQLNAFRITHQLPVGTMAQRMQMTTTEFLAFERLDTVPTTAMLQNYAIALGTTVD
ncbi:hypothetical protein ACFP3T_01665 [Lactiplantibacillus dongliensis]|uniref:HTH cro/C1-type domain-containing protein n=1 Tax=Lactiplantibacillus dongliensis TaxID=2559919 RepID=A0ABW1R0S8_9LACO|nr:hypothetical protein [Lactiplantibacillus dongliensis]